MKKFTLGSIFLFAFLAATVIGCTDDSTTVQKMNNDAASVSEETLERSSVWDDVIGYDRGNNIYEITVNPELLIKDIQAILNKAGTDVTLTDINIVQKNATNNPTDTAFMLVATDGTGTAVALWLKKEQSTFKFDNTLENPKLTSCRGCASGCNLEYFKLDDGRKIPYCNENGCVYNCTKTETSLD